MLSWAEESQGPHKLVTRVVDKMPLTDMLLAVWRSLHFLFLCRPGNEIHGRDGAGCVLGGRR